MSGTMEEIPHRNKKGPNLHQLGCHELETLLLESLDDLGDEAPLDAVGFDHDEGPLCLGIGHLAAINQ